MKPPLIFLTIAVLILSGCISNGPAAKEQENKNCDGGVCPLKGHGSVNLPSDRTADEKIKDQPVEDSMAGSINKTVNNSLLEKQKENERLRDQLNAEIAEAIKKRAANKTVGTTTLPRISVTSTTQLDKTSTDIGGQPADKVEVFHFHGNSQCYSCKTIGAYSEETINTYFPDELKSGKLVYAHVNYDLPENKELARKYGAASSSLWIGVYKNKTLSKEQDINVWYKIDDKKGFMDYLRNAIEKKLRGQ